MEERARKLRQRQSNAETLLWSAVRGRQLGCKFRRQHTIGPYIVDFSCLEKRLVIELDGEQPLYLCQISNVLCAQKNPTPVSEVLGLGLSTKSRRVSVDFLIQDLIALQHKVCFVRERRGDQRLPVFSGVGEEEVNRQLLVFILGFSHAELMRDARQDGL